MSLTRPKRLFIYATIMRRLKQTSSQRQLQCCYHLTKLLVSDIDLQSTDTFPYTCLQSQWETITARAAQPQLIHVKGYL